jgi:transposase
MKRRTFSNDFKLDAIGLIKKRGYSIAQACEAMSIGESALRRWLAQHEQELSGQTPKGRALTAEQQHIQHLERRIRDLEMDKEILKKATALLMSDGIKPTR